MYADNLILISKSVKNLQLKLDWCAMSGTKIDLVFNPKKSYYYCSDCNVNVKLPCSGATFNYLDNELRIKQKRLCMITDNSWRKFLNTSMSLCRNTEQ